MRYKRLIPAVLAIAYIATSALANTALDGTDVAWSPTGGFMEDALVAPFDLWWQEPDGPKAYWTNAAWEAWGRSSANGTADFLGFDGNDPNSTPVTITLSAPRQCGGQTLFTRLATYGDPAIGAVRFTCFITLGDYQGAASDFDGIGDSKPARVWLGGGASTIFYRLHWRHWGKRQATAKGKGYWRPPYARSVPIRVIAADPGPCHGYNVYRKFKVLYPGRTTRYSSHTTCID